MNVFHCSTKAESVARLEVRAQGFWGVHHQQAYFDVRVLNPLDTSNSQTTTSTCFRSCDREKHWVYEQRVSKVEQDSFTPLAFSALVGVSRPMEITYKKLVLLLATKKDHHYSIIISFIQCQLSFSLLWSAIMCLQGSNCTTRCPEREINFTLAVSESWLLSSESECYIHM